MTRVVVTGGSGYEPGYTWRDAVAVPAGAAGREVDRG
jgi:hypothetical protein